MIRWVSKYRNFMVNTILTITVHEICKTKYMLRRIIMHNEITEKNMYHKLGTFKRKKKKGKTKT